MGKFIWLQVKTCISCFLLANSESLKSKSLTHKVLNTALLSLWPKGQEGPPHTKQELVFEIEIIQLWLLSHITHKYLKPFHFPKNINRKNIESLWVFFQSNLTNLFPGSYIIFYLRKTGSELSHVNLQCLKEYDEDILEIFIWFLRHYKEMKVVKYFRKKISILNVWLSSEYTSG